MKRIEKLLKKAQQIRLEDLDQDMLEKYETAQELIGEIYKKAEKKMNDMISDYSFLSRDHVFFDGDHINHSGAV